MSYIFIIGAPGSRWSAVARSIYQSTNIDRSDANKERTYNSSMAKHQGAYFDPGMEFGEWFPNIQTYDRQHVMSEFDRPFKNLKHVDKSRIIKSHTLSLNIDYLAEEWKFSKTILVYRPNDECFSWWQEAGGFNIGYPSYAWYKDDDNMKLEINKQNTAILKYMEINKLDWNINDSAELCMSLSIAPTKKFVKYNDINTKICIIN